jgi:hypothetical protein
MILRFSSDSVSEKNQKNQNRTNGCELRPQSKMARALSSANGCKLSGHQKVRIIDVGFPRARDSMQITSPVQIIAMEIQTTERLRAST